jgi:transcriptional regulator with XRE-family HTH domain
LKIIDFSQTLDDTVNMEDKGIINRFIELRKKYGPSQAKFGDLLGVTDVSISKMESGKTTINEKHIKLISGVLGIREAWLRTGEGSMFKDEKVPEEDTLMEIFRSLSPEGRKMVLDYAKLILKNEKAMRGEQEGGEKAEHLIHSKERG